MKQIILLILLVLFSAKSGFSQNQFAVIVKGIKQNDSVLVTIQRSAEFKDQKWAKYAASGSSKVDFQLASGNYAIVIDAKGYTFPSAKTIVIPTQTSAEIILTPMLNTDFQYNWKDDDSYVGHATQVYVNEPRKLVVLDSSFSVPSDYSSIKLRNEFGVILSNDSEYWSSEDSYRLYTSLKSLPIIPFGEGQKVDFENGKNVKSVFFLTKQQLAKDLTIKLVNGIQHVTISQSAFTYASPQVANLDGLKMKFYSKRLHQAILNYFTDFGRNTEQVHKISTERYGITFMKPDQQTKALMNEDSSNFQEFFSEEKINILSMLEELPEGFHKQEGLKYFVRRINGQTNPKYPTAPAIAWTGINTIEFMSGAFNNAEITYVQRLILHEKAHFLWEFTFEEQLRKDWIKLGDWFVDPTSISGWSTSNTTEFVSAYAHQKNPNEDMAESIASYVTNPDILRSRSMRKYEFIRDRIMHGTRYIAQIREDLTFMVYNLFPDYTYPGKIIGLTIDVKGKSEENKEVTITLKLNSKDPKLDGGSHAYMRLASTIGTIHDIPFTPRNGSTDSILIGKTTFSKHEKNGYWNIVSLNVFDKVSNSRMENTSTIGFKLYIENPLEDISPPKWREDLKLQVIKAKFGKDGQILSDNSGIEMQGIKAAYSFYDNSPMERSITRFFFPKLDKAGVQIYEHQIQDKPLIDVARGYDNKYNSIKYFEGVLAVPEYYPAGYYSVSMLNAQDMANNYTDVFFMKDTAAFNIPIAKKNNGLYKGIRDSIYIKTAYPDYIAPEIDLNRIRIVATPTNPKSPDGETKVDIALLIRDLSDFAGHESGLKQLSYSLRDPLGKEYYYSGQSTSDTIAKYFYNLTPDNNSDWKPINLSLLLPKGSAPGKWGISSMQTLDRAGNFRNYSFVEIIRFDIIKSDIVLQKDLKAQILNKFINKASVESISASISCKPCQGKKYVYTVYSLMGGNVVRGEGILDQDSVVINKISVSGVLDGVIYLTVQLKDDKDQLIATTNTIYTKDTQLPKSYLLQTNLQDQGYSNLDKLNLEVKSDAIDINGKLVLEFDNFKLASTGGGFVQVNKDSPIKINSSISKTLMSINSSKVSELADGIIGSKLIITDPFENEGLPVVNYFNKVNNQIRYLGTELKDSDLDGIVDQLDNCLSVANTNQSDIDKDGIGDTCDNDIFPLPGKNFTITTTGETCSSLDNGKINITAENSFDYQVTLTKSGSAAKDFSFTKSLDISNLSSGNYTLCFSIKGKIDRKLCYDLVITEPKDLSVYSQLNPAKNILKLALSGGSTYRISLNDQLVTTSNSSYNLELKNGWNKVRIVTDKECQGVYQEDIFVNEKVLVFPNPFTDILNIKINQEDSSTIRVKVYDSSGFPVYQAMHALQDGIIQLNLSRLDSGYYTIAIGKDVYKVLKK